MDHMMINDLAMLRQRELLAESEKRRRLLPALKQLEAQHELHRAIRRFLKLDGDARQLANELPSLVREAQRRLAGRTRACRGCPTS